MIAAVHDDREAMIGESADLVFHLMVLLADMDISLEDITIELARREGLSGLARKGIKRKLSNAHRPDRTL